MDHKHSFNPANPWSAQPWNPSQPSAPMPKPPGQHATPRRPRREIPDQDDLFRVQKNLNRALNAMPRDAEGIEFVENAYKGINRFLRDHAQ